jgi:hypothetical protein
MAADPILTPDAWRPPAHPPPRGLQVGANESGWKWDWKYWEDAYKQGAQARFCCLGLARAHP